MDKVEIFFLALISVIGILNLVYLFGYADEYKNKYSIPWLYFLSVIFPLSMMGVIIAKNVFNFIFCWELMSMISYLLVIYDFKNKENIKKGFIYLIMTQLSALLILLGFLLIATNFNWDMNFESLQSLSRTGLGQKTLIPFMMIFLGCSIKMGLAPFHFWLPLAHSIAPSNISAMMSSLMVKIPLFLLIRMIVDFVEPNYITAYMFLGFGIVSMLVGSFYAAIESNLKKLLAYSTIENIGFCTAALSFVIFFKKLGLENLVSVALIATLLHILNHALFKSNLFFGAGSIIKASHQKDLNQMGGLIHKMPISSITFLFSTLSAAGMPFFNGFVGEWIVYKLLISGIKTNSIISFLTFPVALLLFSLVAGVVFLTFAKLYSISFLGSARSPEAENSSEVNFLMLIPSVILSGSCIFLGINPYSLQPIWQGILKDLNLPYQANEFLDDFQLSPFTNNSPEFPSLTLVIIVSLILLLVLIINIFLKTRFRTAEAWGCGQSKLEPSMQYTASSFSQPARRLFGVFTYLPNTKDLKTVYKYGLSHLTYLRSKLHNNVLQRYLLYIAITLLGGIIYAKYF